MTLVYDLPVYKDTYDLLIKVFDAVKHYRREYKYNLGDKIKQEVLDVMMCIYRSNVSQQKASYLQTAREHLEILKILLRLSKDLKLINIETHALLMQKTEVISKQITQWQKWDEKRKT